MKKSIQIVFLFALILSCSVKRELLVPVLLHYDLYYPDEAREQGLEGLVYVRASVNEEGKSEKVFLAKSSGNSLLDSAAVRTAKTFVFSPAMSGDKPIKTWVLVPIEFKLKMVHPEYWITEVKVLQRMIDSEYNKEWVDDLYELYQQVIYVPQDVHLEMNYYIRQAVLEKTAHLWEGFWASYPSNILLFVDVVERFPESFTSLEAKADFKKFLEKDAIAMKYNLSPAQADSLIHRLRAAME